MLRDARINLDLTIDAVVKGSGVSKPTVINLERGHGLKSSDDAVRHFLTRVFFDKRPLTPTEKDRLVWKSLLPHAPYPDDPQPTSPRGPGRPKKGNSECPTTSPTASRTERLASASLSSPSMAKSVSSPTFSKTASSSVPITTTATTETFPSSLLDSDAQGGFVHSAENPPLDSNIIQARDAFLRAITGAKTSVSTPEPMAAASVAPLWSNSTLLDIRATARIRAMLTDDMPGVLSMRQKLYADLHAESPAWLDGLTLPENYTDTQFKKWRDAVNARLRRVFSVKLRDRKNNEELTQKKQVVASYAMRYAAAVESHGHSKGAYQNRSWMDLRATLQGIWDVAEFRERVSEIMGRDISYGMMERIFRNEFGKVSPAERAAKNYFAATKATDPEYAGAHVEIDGTGIPVDVLEAWGRQRNNGDLAQQAVFLTDRASLRTWVHVEATTSEVYLWSPLILKYFESENTVPETMTMDEGGRGFNALRNASKWTNGVELDAGQRIALASGARPYVHAPGHAQGKGTVEANVKSGKSALKRILVKRFAGALMKEIASAPINYRTVQQQHEWMQILAEWEAALNSRVLKRVHDGSLTRNEVWNLPEYAARRAERALAADWRDRYRDIISRGFTMELRSDNGLFQDKARAEIRTPLLEPIAKGSIAILFPGGMRAGDDQYGDDLLRGVIVEDRKGQPRYHAIEALKVKKTFLGFEADRPKVGTFESLPETDEDRRRRAWVEGGKIIPAAIREAHAAAAQKNGTTDTVL